MKFEAKSDGAGGVAAVPVSKRDGTPWVSIDQQDSITECSQLGMGYHLVKNNEWMSVTSNIAQNAGNWCQADGSSCGAQGKDISATLVTNNTLVLNRGHSDNNPGSACDGQYESVETDCSTFEPSATSHEQKRVHRLLNTDRIWDLSGNVWEWVDYFNKTHKATPTTASFDEYTAVTGVTKMPKSYLVPTAAKKSWWSDSWNSSQNIGKYYASTNGAGGALLRGGGWHNGSESGLFSALLSHGPTHAGTNIGFRCVVSLSR